MGRIAIRPGDRFHMLIWRVHPSSKGDPGWRAARAVNGVTISFGVRFDSWEDAIAYALSEVM